MFLFVYDPRWIGLAIGSNMEFMVEHDTSVTCDWTVDIDQSHKPSRIHEASEVRLQLYDGRCKFVHMYICVQLYMYM